MFVGSYHFDQYFFRLKCRRRRRFRRKTMLTKFLITTNLISDFLFSNKVTTCRSQILGERGAGGRGDRQKISLQKLPKNENSVRETLSAMKLNREVEKKWYLIWAKLIFDNKEIFRIKRVWRNWNIWRISSVCFLQKLTNSSSILYLRHSLKEEFFLLFKCKRSLFICITQENANERERGSERERKRDALRNVSQCLGRLLRKYAHILRNSTSQIIFLPVR